MTLLSAVILQDLRLVKFIIRFSRKLNYQILLGVTDQAVKHVLISPDKLNYYRLWKTLITNKIILRFSEIFDANNQQTIESVREVNSTSKANKQGKRDSNSPARRDADQSILSSEHAIKREPPVKARVKYITVADLLMLAHEISLENEELVGLLTVLWPIANTNKCCSDLTSINKLHLCFDAIYNLSSQNIEKT